VPGGTFRGGGPPLSPGVGDLDAQRPAEEPDGELEVPAGHAAVRDGVGGEFGDEQRGGVGRRAAVRHTPPVEKDQRSPELALTPAAWSDFIRYAAQG
jgi:hypothetical protein